MHLLLEFKVSNVWEYLDNVWKLAGFVLVVFASILKLLPVKKLSTMATERLIHKGINLLFFLALVSIVLGFVTSQNDEQTSLSTEQIPIAAESTQAIDNNTGTAVNAGGNVSFNQPPPPTQDRTDSDSSSNVNQQIDNNSGIAINAGGDISATLQERYE